MKDLMKPKVKVIAQYPNCPYQIGEVLLFIDGIENGGTPDLYDSTLQEDCCIKSVEVEKYPHLFRKMHWSEGMELKDMPEYVKYKGVVYPSGGWCRSYEEQMPWVALDMIGRLWASNIEPATREEYEQYLTTKTN